MSTDDRIKTPLPYPVLHYEELKTLDASISITFHKGNIVYTDFRGNLQEEDIKALKPLYLNGIRHYFVRDKKIVGVVQISYITKMTYLLRKAYSTILTDISKTYPSKKGIIIGANSINRIGIALIEFFARFPLTFVTSVEKAIEQIDSIVDKDDIMTSKADEFQDERHIIMRHLSHILWGSKTPISSPLDDNESLAKIISALNILHNDIQTLITEKDEYDKELQQTLLREQKLVESRESFISHLSHEVRTPMTGMLGMISLVKQTNLADEQLTLVESIEKSSKNLLSILNEILDISRILSQKVFPNPTPCNIRTFIQTVIKNIPPTAISPQTTISYSVAPQFPDIIRCDYNMLSKIITALLDNALQHTVQGSVTLTATTLATEQENIMQFVVSDTGSGIPLEKQEKIFNPFYSIGTETKRTGNGLGLAVVKNLTELLQGSYTLHSEVGTGTTVTIILPLIKSYIE